jgi:hypothetical protein
MMLFLSIATTITGLLLSLLLTTLSVCIPTMAVSFATTISPTTILFAPTGHFKDFNIKGERGYEPPFILKS